MTIYAVSPSAQPAEVKAYCFKACGGILIGGLEIEQGIFCPCRTEPCPYEEKSLELGRAVVFGNWEQVIVRKLRTVRPELKEVL